MHAHSSIRAIKFRFYVRYRDSLYRKPLMAVHLTLDDKVQNKAMNFSHQYFFTLLFPEKKDRIKIAYKKYNPLSAKKNNDKNYPTFFALKNTIIPIIKTKKTQ
jgi:hypothetical protein